MTDLPYMPLYIADFEGSTAFLSLEEEGLYFRLLRLMWQTPGGTVPNNKEWLSRRLRISPEHSVILDTIIEDFCQIKSKRLAQKRLLEEYIKTYNKILARKKAGKLGGVSKSMKSKEKTPSKRLANSKQTPSIQNQNQNHIKDSNILSEKFDVFWKTYDKPVDKKQALAQWETKVKTVELADKVILSASAYATSREPRFRKSPMRWLRDENWNDAIITSNKVKALDESPEAYGEQSKTGEGW